MGEFKDGRGEFFCQDTINGRAIWTRYIWSDITANSGHFETFHFRMKQLAWI